MRTSFGPLVGLALTLMSTPAFAQDETPAVTISGGATLVSDYRFRGISQTDKDFAVQGTFTVSHKSGFYATVWGSSIDDYIAAGSDQEIDPAVGLDDIVELGATVQAGQPLMRVHARTEKDAETAMQRLREAVRIENRMTQPLPPLVWQRIGAGGEK